jgi:hypothetical protein
MLGRNALRVGPVPASPLLTGSGRSDNPTIAGTGFSGPNKELNQGGPQLHLKPLLRSAPMGYIHCGVRDVENFRLNSCPRIINHGLTKEEVIWKS